MAVDIENVKNIIFNELAELPLDQRERILQKVKDAFNPAPRFNVTSYFNSKVKENKSSALLLSIAAAAIMCLNKDAIEHAKNEIVPEIENITLEDCLKLFIKASRAMATTEEKLKTVEAPLLQTKPETIAYDPLDDLG